MNASIKIYNLLLAKNFSKQEAEEFIEHLDSAVEETVEDKRSGLATREDIKDLKDDIKEIRQDINKVRSGITSLAMWMVGSIVGQTGLIFLILKLVGVFEK